MLHAVIGIGSNSTRMLIGEVDRGTVTYARRMREGTRLFAGLENGQLSMESMSRTVDAVARFVMQAQAEGVRALHVIATSAARDAQNGAAFAEMIQAVAGVPLTIVGGEEEAALSYMGGTQGAGYSGLIDIGGGSTEIAVGDGRLPESTGSAQLGAVRLFGEVPVLGGDGFAAALAIARARAAEVWAQMRQGNPPKKWFGVGGTFTCLASLDKQLPQFDRDAVDGHTLHRGAVENWAHRLAKMTQAERAVLPGMLPQRADIIAHGAIVLLGVMEALDIAEIIVSNKTNLDGYLLRIAREMPAEDSVVRVQSYYDAAVDMEWNRLEKGFVEFEINKRFIDRYIKPGDRVLDVGGGPGRYSLHLAGRGAHVTLVDLSEGNVAFAKEKASEMGLAIHGISADARMIDTVVDGEFDAILLMGPLYHLLEEADRVKTVEACLRRLKPGGVLIVAFISMMAGMIYAAREAPETILWEGEDTFYEKIINREDFAGPAFTHAFFIQPKHVLPFMAQFPLEKLHLVASESVLAPFMKQIGTQPPEVVAKWLELAERLCEREDFITYSEHLLYIGRKEEKP